MTGVAVTATGWGWRHPGRLAWAVRGVDLAITPGEHVLLLGPSGSGKSTLMAGLAGLLDPANGDEEGSLLVAGLPARQARLDAVQAGAARVGLLLQDPQTQTVLARCGDDVAFGLENHAVPFAEIWPRVEVALRGVEFPYGLGHSTARLSGGERQRLALAGVLALRPGLLLLDEPTAMLDPDGTAMLHAQVSRLLERRTATCVLVEHRVARWLDLVDRVVVLEPGGGVSADGTPSEVLGREGRRLAASGVWVPGRVPVTHPSRRRTRHGGGERAERGEVILAASGVAVTRPGSTRPAVRDVTLEIRAGSATCVVGPNGAGKSTLALALAGLVAPSAGVVEASVSLTAGARSRQPHRWRPRELVTRIGTAFQEPQHQFVAATVAAELAVGPRQIGLPTAEIEARVTQLLTRLRLDHLARANPFTLSGGEQRRLSVATVLATRPHVLILDEPTFGQDARTWAELVDLLRELLDQGSAVVAVTHDESLVEALAGRVLRLRDGAPAKVDGSTVGVA